MWATLFLDMGGDTERRHQANKPVAHWPYQAKMITEVPQGVDVVFYSNSIWMFP